MYARHITLIISIPLIIIISNNPLFGQEKEIDTDQLLEMGIEDLLSLQIVSASNQPENLNKAPATIIVITEQDIKERGYFEMYEVLQDLPGFDLSRAFGTDHHYAYVRGYRKTTSDQMLLMLDGIIMNHLYNHNMEMFAQFPMQNIKQIEIVYGPASAIYGPNAFAGVINIITRKEETHIVQTALGQNNTNIIDLHFTETLKDFEFSLSGRLYQTDGPDLEGRTPMLAEELYTNPFYWGDYALTDFIGYKSPIESYFFNPSIKFKGLILGTINYLHNSGYGSEFAGGTTLNSSSWQKKENTVYARYEKEGDKISSKTLIRYRRSDIPGSSTYYWRSLTQGVDTIVVAPGNRLDQFGLSIPNNENSDQTYIVDVNTQYAEYWQANNAGFSFFQDFNYIISDDLIINFGLKYNRRRLNRDYVINSNSIDRAYVHILGDPERTPLNSPTLSSIEFPERPNDNGLDQENHNTITDRGIYAQMQYAISEKTTFFGGIRYDHNSIWNKIVSPRVGMIIEANERLVVKAFYGTAFLEPSARILYGGWQGSLSNDQLKPEKMRTLEVSATYTKNIFSVGINGFLNNAPDAIGQQPTTNIPINLGKRRMIGAEAQARVLVRNISPFWTKFKGDLFISYINSEEDLNDTGTFENTGNMAPIKVKTILTAHIKDQLSLSFQNRYTSEIETVSTNPIREISGHFVSDLFVEYNDIFIEGFSLGAKVYNLFNADYFHPGYRGADAGETSVNDALSSSTYNSRLPQPERSLLISLKYEF